MFAFIAMRAEIHSMLVGDISAVILAWPTNAMIMQMITESVNHAIHSGGGTLVVGTGSSGSSSLCRVGRIGNGGIDRSLGDVGNSRHGVSLDSVDLSCGYRLRKQPLKRKRQISCSLRHRFFQLDFPPNFAAKGMWKAQVYGAFLVSYTVWTTVPLLDSRDVISPARFQH
jgi:hypothetical protein